MNHWTKTLSLVAVAGAAVAVTLFTRPANRQVTMLSDQGAPLAPDLKDALDIRSIEVVSFDEQAVKTRGFKVESDGKQWTIPSANNYPADAQEGVSRAAAAFSGLIRERVVSENKLDFGKFGVIDPSDPGAVASAGGLGTRVTIKDASGRALVDVILGKAVVSTDVNQTAAKKRYVREAGKSRVFITTIEGAFSTRFVDWVETDLLKFQTETAAQVLISRYNIDPKTRRTTAPVVLTLKRTRMTDATMVNAAPDAAKPWGPWQLTSEPGGPPASDEKIADSKIADALTALTQLRIAGVKPKPANLMRMLSTASNELALQITDQISLQQHGFYVSAEGGLVSNEGQMIISCDDGVTYTLMLGELAGESDVSASGGQVGAATDPNSPDKKTDSRFVMVLASFDPAQVASPGKSTELLATEAAAAAMANDPANPPTEELKSKLDTLTKQHTDALLAHGKKLEAGQKRADDLAKRFSAWYYLVDLKSLDQLRPTRESLVSKVAPPPTPPPMFPPTPMQPETPPATPPPAPPTMPAGGQ